MSHDDKLAEVAAKLDDISLTLEEIKSKVTEEGAPTATKLDGVQKEVTRAADAIDEAVDPDE